jgi:hypothetical protein
MSTVQNLASFVNGREAKGTNHTDKKSILNAASRIWVRGIWLHIESFRRTCILNFRDNFGTNDAQNFSLYVPPP